MGNVSTRPQKAATPVTAAVTPVTTPKPVRQLDQEGALYDLLDQAKTICNLIAHNFGGDGSFEDPSAAPGIVPLFACVADLMRAADILAPDLDAHPAVANNIEQARGLAEHLLGMSEERWLGDDQETRIFRIGDCEVSMGYWTIEKLIGSAMELPLHEAQA